MDLSAHNHKEQKHGKVKFYLGSSIIGVARIAIGFPIEHPIDAVKV